ncbi:MAG: nuclear transport factor 2 family protein [Rubrivivax sp.]
MSQARIQAFYDAFRRLDAETMRAAYAEHAVFSDPAFDLQGRDRIGSMWNLLTDAVRAKGQDVWRLDLSQVTDRSAHWEPHYRFSATGRIVHNVIDAEFVFDAQGLIAEHRDRFDFWRWSRQALGPVGTLLGWTPMLRNKVRQQAGANLDAWIAKKRR